MSEERKPMAIEDCKMVMQQLTMFAQLLLPIPLKEFLDQMKFEEALVPLIDPTQFIKNQDKAREVKALAKAAYDYQNAVKKILPDDLQKQIMDDWNEKVEGNVETTEVPEAKA